MRKPDLKQININVPSAEWHKRLKKLAGERGITAYVLMLLEPVLNGRLEPEFEDGRVLRFWQTGTESKRQLPLPRRWGNPVKRKQGGKDASSQ